MKSSRIGGGLYDKFSGMEMGFSRAFTVGLKSLPNRRSFANSGGAV